MGATLVMDKIVLLGSVHHIVLDDMELITIGSTFLYAKEHELENLLLEAFAEMSFIVHQFKIAHEILIASGTPELDEYIRQMNDSNLQQAPNIIIELHAFDLSTYFKSFLLLAKAVLDKVIPLYSYQFYDSLRQFSDKGIRLIRSVKSNKHIKRKSEFISLIESAKNEWMDSLIDLRDQYAHYSSLREYLNFWIPGEWIGKRNFVGMQDFYKPSVYIGGKQVEALEYMLMIKVRLVEFLRGFLQLCEFTPDRRPKHYLSCECGYTFAKRSKSRTRHGRLSLTSAHIELQIKDEASVTFLKFMDIMQPAAYLSKSS
jgi:hypothetical protein